MASCKTAEYEFLTCRVGIRIVTGLQVNTALIKSA